MQIMDAIYEEDSSVQLLISYSQGGGRAQFLECVENKYAKKTPVITFQRRAEMLLRDLFDEGRTNYLEYVDPTRYYECVRLRALLDLMVLGHNIARHACLATAKCHESSVQVLSLVGYPASVVSRWVPGLWKTVRNDDFDACRYFRIIARHHTTTLLR